MTQFQGAAFNGLLWAVAFIVVFGGIALYLNHQDAAAALAAAANPASVPAPAPAS